MLHRTRKESVKERGTCTERRVKGERWSNYMIGDSSIRRGERMNENRKRNLVALFYSFRRPLSSDERKHRISFRKRKVSKKRGREDYMMRRRNECELRVKSSHSVSSSQIIHYS